MHGPLGVVLARRGQAEGADEEVVRQILRLAPEAHDLGTQARRLFLQPRSKLLGAWAGGQRIQAHQPGDQHRRRPAYGPRRGQQRGVRIAVKHEGCPQRVGGGSRPRSPASLAHRLPGRRPAQGRPVEDSDEIGRAGIGHRPDGAQGRARAALDEGCSQAGRTRAEIDQAVGAICRARRRPGRVRFRTR